MMLEERNTHARENYAPPHAVLTNDDLLTEILIRLPILCIHLFTTVSKQWLKIFTSPVFTFNHSQITKVDPPVGLFINHIRSSFHCDFVSLDPIIKLRKYTIDKSFTLGSTEAVDNVNILQSCNGLLLCTDYAHDDSNFYGCAGLRLVFDPTKSPYYKVVRAGSNSYEIVIQIYTSKTAIGACAGSGLTTYALYILTVQSIGIMPYIGLAIRKKLIRVLWQYASNDNNHTNTHMLHLEGKLFESRGCLLLVRRDYIGSSEFTIYEKGCYVWSIKYLVDTDDFMSPLLEGWSIRSIAWSIVLGETEEDSFLVINLSGKVVKYNLISKTLREIYDMGSNQVADDYLDGFIPPFAMYDIRSKKVDHGVYEFISSSTSV
ncbi:hypothetical protein Tco_0924554 [Tanacetum coccineum]|uniref:F-box domain-containing protein n=1 Tax=Tanacetum coccineum TaxID=301880 RepID=A0ABQ5D5L9_9ASTR